ncbi:MAG: hydrogenase maturation protease [Firmicutes bacterium]|nr:hydrogenase maturation protease [Bacillota bacterium]
MTDREDTMEPRKPLILALGHSLRGDDGLGLHILRELEEKCRPYADCLAAGQDLLGWLNHLICRPRLIIIDALDGGYPPGTVIRLVRSADSLPETLLWDETHSHGSNLGLALALARQMGGPLPTTIVYGIQPMDVTLGEGLTPCVTQAARFLFRQFISDRPWDELVCLSDAIWLAAD